MFNNGSKTMNKLKNQTRTSKNTKRRFFFVYTVRSSLFDTNSRTLTRIKNSSRTRWTMFKNQTIMKNEKSEFEKWKINKSYKKRPKLWYHLIRSSLKERIWSDHFLVGLHGPDRNPVRDSVRLLVGTPQRLRKSHWSVRDCGTPRMVAEGPFDKFYGESSRIHLDRFKFWDKLRERETHKRVFLLWNQSSISSEDEKPL